MALELLLEELLQGKLQGLDQGIGNPCLEASGELVEQVVLASTDDDLTPSLTPVVAKARVCYLVIDIGDVHDKGHVIPEIIG